METKEYTPETIAKSVAQLTAIPSKTFLTGKEAIRFALSILDLTTLEGSDNTQTIIDLCNKAKSYTETGLPNVAAVCIYPVFVKHAKKLLSKTDIHVASVAGAFPSGQSSFMVKIIDIKNAVDDGADEIDMVISRGKFLEGDYEAVKYEIRMVKAMFKDIILKVILETGEIIEPNLIYKASMLAMESGADFIKTSTGKIPVSATLEASYVMLQAIKDYHMSSGRRVGFKAAGGISTVEQARDYIALVEGILGPSWLDPSFFRIGASRLANNAVTYLNEKE